MPQAIITKGKGQGKGEGRRQLAYVPESIVKDALKLQKEVGAENVPEGVFLASLVLEGVARIQEAEKDGKDATYKATKDGSLWIENTWVFKARPKPKQAKQAKPAKPAEVIPSQA